MRSQHDVRAHARRLSRLSGAARVLHAGRSLRGEEWLKIVCALARRSFIGQYAQIDWKPDDRWDLLAGIRLNETDETLSSTHVDGFDPTANLSATSTKNETRLAGTVGVSYRTWKSGFDETVVFADYRNAFKPAAIDFGPDYRPEVPNPETAQSYGAGIKGVLMGGRLDYQAGVFLLDFKNLLVTTTDTMGNPLVQNAGGEHACPAIATTVASNTWWLPRGRIDRVAGRA